MEHARGTRTHGIDFNLGLTVALIRELIRLDLGTGA